MSVQVGHPRGVVDVGLAPGNILDVSGAGQGQLEAAFEHMPYSGPVDTGGLHHHVRDLQALQPAGQLNEVAP
jgi:hypothetical protein